VYTALQAMTTWPAYQHFEESLKGQLKQGMQADLIILDNNPLKIKPAELHNLQVLETISRGETVYSKN